MKGALTAAQISEALNLTSMRDRQWHIQACCALTGDGLFEGLDWIVSQIS
ncbi:35757_t:CDS:2, partial [Racocetra persica]